MFDIVKYRTNTGLTGEVDLSVPLEFSYDISYVDFTVELEQPADKTLFRSWYAEEPYFNGFYLSNQYSLRIFVLENSTYDVTISTGTARRLDYALSGQFDSLDNPISFQIKVSAVPVIIDSIDSVIFEASETPDSFRVQKVYANYAQFDSADIKVLRSDSAQIANGFIGALKSDSATITNISTTNILTKEIITENILGGTGNFGSLSSPEIIGEKIDLEKYQLRSSLAYPNTHGFSYFVNKASIDPDARISYDEDINKWIIEPGIEGVLDEKSFNTILGEGNDGEVLYANHNQIADNGNYFDFQYILFSGNFVDDSTDTSSTYSGTELTSYEEFNTVGEFLNTWNKFSFTYPPDNAELDSEGAFDISNYSLSDEYSIINYNSTKVVNSITYNDIFFVDSNSRSFLGVYYPSEEDNFKITATFQADSNEGFIGTAGIILSLLDSNNYPLEYIAFIRQPENSNNTYQQYGGWSAIYNYGTVGELQLENNSTSTIDEAIPGVTYTNVTIEITKTGSTFVAKTSQFNSSDILDDTQIILITDNYFSSTSGFQGGVSVGLGAINLDNAIISNISLEKSTDNIVGGETSSINTNEVYDVYSGQSLSQEGVTIYDRFGTGKFFHNPNSGKTFYKNPMDTWLISKLILNTDDLPEGDQNLYFTTERARASVSAQSPIVYDQNTGIIGSKITGEDPISFDSNTGVIGFTGEFLSNLDPGLPIGKLGQVPFIEEDRTNKYIPDYIVVNGRFAEDSQDLNLIFNQPIPPAPSLEEIFNQWYRFSHSAADAYPARASELDAWEFDPVTESIRCTVNSGTYIGFVSNASAVQYTFAATLSSTNRDNDTLSIVIAFVEEGGREHTLSAIRTMGGFPPSGGWGIYYNYAQSDQRLLTEIPVPWISGGWLDNGQTRVSISKSATTVTAVTSQNGSTTLDPTTELTVDLTSDPDLAKFQVATKNGIGSLSQTDATFSDLDNSLFPSGPGPVVNMFDNYTYSDDSSSGTGWSQDSDTFDQYYPVGRLYHSPLTGKTFFKSDNETFLIADNFTIGTLTAPKHKDSDRDGLLIPKNGDIIYNEETHKFQGYANGVWVNLH